MLSEGLSIYFYFKEFGFNTAAVKNNKDLLFLQDKVHALSRYLTGHRMTECRGSLVMTAETEGGQTELETSAVNVVRPRSLHSKPHEQQIIVAGLTS